jgi:hypothetical protein
VNRSIASEVLPTLPEVGAMDDDDEPPAGGDSDPS